MKKLIVKQEARLLSQTEDTCTFVIYALNNKPYVFKKDKTDVYLDGLNYVLKFYNENDDVFIEIEGHDNKNKNIFVKAIDSIKDFLN